MRRHPTHSADDAKGVMSFGKLQLEGDTFVALGYAVIAGLVLWTFLVLLFGANLWVAFGVAALPFAVCFFYIVLFVHRRPPGFARDLCQLLIEGNGTWCAPHVQPPHPLQGGHRS